MEQMIDEITIANESVQMKLVEIPLEEIHLDADNPRIRYRFGLGTQQKSLDEVILSMSEVKLLRKDIKMTGGLRERIILQPNGDGYKVVEGNCRAACYRSLAADDPDDTRWHNIPARILPTGFDPRKVAIHDLHMGQGDIATYMRQSKSTVNRLLNAYTFMIDRFLTIDDGKYADAGEGKWSYFDELYRSKDLRMALESIPDFGDKFCRWVGEGRIPTGADVRKMPAVIRNPQAMEKFDSGAKLADVMKVVEADEPEHGSDFFKLLAKVRDNCTNAAQVKEILRIRSDKNARARVLETYEALVDFMRLADVDVPKPAED
jgi:hypothetical protein